MRNAARILTLTLGAAALAGCHKSSPPVNNQQMAIDDNVAMSGLAPGTQIETLPPDESSAASNGELVKGNDNPDVNDLGNGN